MDLATIMHKITLTIAVPTYNRAELLDACLGELSALNQQMDDVELLILDNNSGDNTQEVCQRWIEAFEGIGSFRIVKREKNIGAVPNILDGMLESQGAYFLFLGDDDRLIPNQFSRLMGLLRESKPFCLGVEIDLPRAKTREFSYRKPKELFKASRLYALTSPLYKSGNAWAAIYNTAEANKVLNSTDVRQWACDNVWSQMSLAILLLSESKLPAAEMGFKFGEQFQQRPFVFGGMTALKSLSDLLVAAQRAGAHLPIHERRKIVNQLCGSLKAPAQQHLRSIVTTWPGKEARESELWNRFLKAAFSAGTQLRLRILIILVFASGLAELLTRMTSLRRNRSRSLDIEVHY